MLHLFHPALVHFSVAFIVTGGCAELWGLAYRQERSIRWGTTLTLAGLASLVPTLASGYLAANTLDVPAAVQPLLDSHERNGWILLGVLCGAQFWKAWCGGRVPDGSRWLYAALMASAVGLAAYGAWLGGRMVYGAGLGVG